jgi:CRISPR-associated Cas5-like protein
MMYYSLFEPATSFGRPTSGQVVLSFRTITVRG